MYLWLLLTLLSGIILGFYDIFKKLALQKNSLLNVLALYSLCSFMLVAFEVDTALQIDKKGLALVFLKSVVIFVSWTMNFMAIRSLPISIITPFATLSPVFTIIFGVVFLGERLILVQAIGIGVMLIAYYFVGKVGKAEIHGLFKNKYLYLMCGAMFLSAISAIIDKVALKTTTTSQMQFWFSLFLTILYFAAWGANNLRTKQGFKLGFNWFIPLMSLFLIVSDRIYFYAVSIPESQISIVMPLRKISVVVSVIIGGIIFKEKNIKKKLVAIGLLVLGIILVFAGK